MKAGAKLAVFCSGYGSNFEAILGAIEKKQLDASVAVMVCDNPKAHALKRASRRGIPVCLVSPRFFKKRSDYEKFLVRVLKSQKIDLVVLAGFMRIFTPYFVRAFRGKMLNIHPSYLPAFKGAHAIRDVYESGAWSTGVTVHWVTEAVDAGPALLQTKVKILKTDTLAKLEARIHAVEHVLYPRAIQKLIHQR